jgi:hypothetical protein
VPHCATGLGQSAVKTRGRDAEVGDDRVSVLVEQHVIRLDVAMNDAAAVRVVERRRDLSADSRGRRGWHRAIAHEDVCE